MTSRYKKHVWTECSMWRLPLVVVKLALVATFISRRIFATQEHIFLESDMRAAWVALLGEGRGHEGARDLIDGKLIECHSSESHTWGRECDHALYLDDVLERAYSAATAPALPRAVDDGFSIAANITAVSQEDVAFSAFFVRYAVTRRPVLLFLPSDCSIGALYQKLEEQSTSSDRDGKKTIEDESKDHESMGRHHGDAGDSSFTPLSDNILGTTGSIHNGCFVDQLSLDLLSACVPYEGEAARSAERPLRFCNNGLLQALPIPPHIASDFVQRSGRNNILTSEDQRNVERFVAGWHNIHRNRWGSSTPVMMCPSGGNMLISVLSGALEILVFEEAALPFLEPIYGGYPCPGTNSSPEGEDRSTIPLYDTSKMEVARDLHSDDTATGSENNEGSEWEFPSAYQVPPGEDDYSSSSWPHEPSFCARIWTDNAREEGSPEHSFPILNARVMKAGDLLFIPSGGAVSWRPDESEAHDETVVLRSCYVDASNFNSVKTQLALYAAVEVGASVLLKAFRSPVFDTSMARQPPATTAADFFSGKSDRGIGFGPWLAGTSSEIVDLQELGGGDASSDSSDDYVGDDGIDSAWGSSLSRLWSSSSSSSSSWESSRSDVKRSKRGGRRGRKSFKEWQDDSRWDLKVLGLTLPTLDAPGISTCGRTNCTVTWISSFVKQDQDQTTVGFNVSFVPVEMNTSNSNSSSSSGSSSSYDGYSDVEDGGIGSGGGGYMEVFIGSSSLRSEHSRSRELLGLGITEAREHSITVDTNLEPDTPYRFSVSVIYGETAGPFSEPSKAAWTAKITAPSSVPVAPHGTPGVHSVTLNVWPPHDNGGSPVTWYHVMLRPAGEHMLSKWQAVGMTEAPAPRVGVSVYDTEGDRVLLKVDHLIPGVAYQFRVCAQNAIGTSPWSSASEPVVVLAAISVNSKLSSLSGFHDGHPHLRLPNVTDATVTYAGERDPPPGEGFDPFEREVHGPTVVLDDRAGHVRVNDSSSRTIDVWTCHFSPRAFRVTAEVILADPVGANRELENRRFIRNRIAMVERGKPGDMPIAYKVLNAQRAGALGVIIADDGQCGNTFDQLCMHGSSPPKGWAALDLPRPWLEVRVPVVLMLATDAERLARQAGEAAEEVEAMAWSSLYDGWFDS